MIFATKAFLIFLPVVLVLYHLLRDRTHKYRVLLIASWLFYTWLSPQYLWVIIACTVIDYAAWLKIESAATDRGRKRWLVLSIVSNLGLLFAFKYAAFATDNAVSLARLFGMEVHDRTWNILLPLGISFHTFQGISYTVDVYRRQIRAVRSFLDYALFVAFFPQLAAGPIVRAVEFLPQMETPPSPTAKQVSEGLHLFLLGLFKKVFIADQLDMLFVSPVFENPAAFDATAQRIACLAWAAQIYCDFSGYSDMAVGIAKWFGFELPQNFNLPYLAVNIADFWRRWHMSLSTWLRDYLYFPMGGSRGSALRTYFNLMVVFVLCGLWHGATWAWLAYGCVMGAAMCLHRVFDRTATGTLWNTVRASLMWKVVSWFITMLFITATLVLIRMPDWNAGGLLLRSLFAVDSISEWSRAIPPWVPVLMVLGLAGHVLAWLRPKGEVPPMVRAAGYVCAVVLLVTLSPGVAKTFIYIAF
jgi:alginate O-acetyltransferase complex protein AlgI